MLTKHSLSHIPPNYTNVDALKSKLTQQIYALEVKLEEVRTSPVQVDMIQALTFREMIHSRKELLNTIS